MAGFFMSATFAADAPWSIAGTVNCYLFDNAHFVRLLHNSDVQAEAWVVEIGGLPASFLICLLGGNELELHLAGTQKKFRRQGCFRALVRRQIEQRKPGQRVFARCYPHSTYAIATLQQEGFITTQHGDPIELTFDGTLLNSPKAVPGAAKRLVASAKFFRQLFRLRD